jgi:hypothetical protein
MDKTLAALFTAWWTTGERDAALVLADRLHELPSEQVADVLLAFRSTINTLPLVAETFARACEAMKAAFAALERMLEEQRQRVV